MFIYNKAKSQTNNGSIPIISIPRCSANAESWQCKERKKEKQILDKNVHVFRLMGQNARLVCFF